MLSSSASFTERDIRERILVPGLAEEVEDLNSTFISTQAVLSNAEKRQLKEEPVRDWVERLRDISYEIEDVLDVWKTVHLKLQIAETHEKCPSQTGPSYCSWLQELARKGDLQDRIGELKKRLDVINQEKEAYKLESDTTMVTPHLALQRKESSAFYDVPKVFGREIQLIKAKLLTSFSQETSNFDVVSIVGMGKTTIAQRIFNEMDEEFDKKIWVCVSDPFDEVRVAKSISEELGASAGSTLQSSLKSIGDSITGKKFMLVLDDVWSKDPSDWTSLFNVLKKGARGSKILVTSHNMEVAKAMDSCYSRDLEKLSEDESWELFSQIAISSKKSEDECERFEEVGKSIAKKCKGLPLALKTLASHLKFKAEREWHKVLDSDLWKLEDDEEGIFVPLLFSYYELPLAIKKCFSYCAIFPRDYEFRTDQLIRLWMSQGYLSTSRNDEDMETVGEEYFQHLVALSFFQDLKYDPDERVITGCKMHAIVHDFAQFMSKDTSLLVDYIWLNKEPSGLTSSSSSSCRNLRHLTVVNVESSKVEVMLSSFSRSNQQKSLQLHTLWMPGCFFRGLGVAYFLNLSQHLCFLKALDLRDSGIEEVPEEIGQLVHLRYLDLSKNWELKRLPETICELCNLQTLLLFACESLMELPNGIGKLINLRHLFHDGMFLPKGVGSLSSLRTLSFFIIAREAANVATIGDLRNLNNLQGRLSILCLNNVKDGEEARKAELRNKGLTGLTLDFQEGEGIEGRNEEEVIEALEPSCHSLEELDIRFYSGKLLPSWIGSLSKLRILGLLKCDRCQELEKPSLGQLPSLEELQIWSFGSCTRIGKEFLGINREASPEVGRGGTNTSTTSSSVLVAFPKLKILDIRLMPEWTEWEDNISISGGNDYYDDDDDLNFKLFPCLNRLKISFCPKLKSLPHFISNSPLQILEIEYCDILQERCRPHTGEDWSKISHIPSITVKTYGSGFSGPTVWEIKDGQLQR